MKIMKNSRKIVAADDSSSGDSSLRKFIRSELSDEICIEVVELAYSEYGMFEDIVFMDSDTFFSDVLGNKDPKDVALAFYNGTDLDEGDSPANPTRKYFRLDKDKNIESTNDIGDIYYHELKNEVVDCIIDWANSEKDIISRMPEVQELMDIYNGSKE